MVALLSTCLAFAAVPSAHAAAKSRPHKVVAGFSTPSGTGYWLVYADGTVTRRGNARMYGDATRVALVRPIVGGAVTPSGKGYWLVASDGGVFTFGDAHFYGSASGGHLHVFPIAGFATGPTDAGYQMITRDALLLNFGKFPLPPHLPGRGFNHGVNNVVGIVPTPTKRGEWIVLGDGGVLAFGDAHYLKGPAHFTRHIQAVFSNPKRQGYALVTTSGAVVRFGAAPG